MRYKTVVTAGVIAANLYAPNGAEARTKSSDPNILFIVADDLGLEALNLYNKGNATTAKTPNIDKLAKQGIVFDNVWGSPLSAPVRAAMLTGRYGHKTGVVNLNIPLKTEEKTLHAALPANYADALIGKWHLSELPTNPEIYGIEHFAGLASGGGVRDYNRWMLMEEGETASTNEYTTTKFTNLALDWINDQDKPWFCWLAYTAPHTPYHLPPTNMHNQGKLPTDSESINANPLPYFMAMIESLDYEIGRLIAGIPKNEMENTIIIFIGDNGTERNIIQSPYARNEGKGSIFEGGLSIPMVISGAGVSRKGVREDALVSATDIFATIMEISGVTMPRYEDSYSFKHLLTSEGEALREYSYSEISNNRMGYQCAIRDKEYKLVVTNGTATAFYRLKENGTEGENIIDKIRSAEAQEVYSKLLNEVNNFNIDYESLKVTATTNQGNQGNNTNTRRATQNTNRTTNRRQQ